MGRELALERGDLVSRELEHQRVLHDRRVDEAELGAMEPLWQDFRNRYIPALDQLLTSIRAEAAEVSRSRDTRLHAALDSALPETLRALTLTQKALLVTSSTRGITSVLVGARKKVYVDDLLRVLGLAKLPLDAASQALRALASATGG